MACWAGISSWAVLLGLPAPCQAVEVGSVAVMVSLVLPPALSQVVVSQVVGSVAVTVLLVALPVLPDLSQVVASLVVGSVA